MITSVDTETGGLSAAKNSLLSIALVQADEDLQPKAELNIFIQPQPGLSIHPEAVKVNGYSPELWEERGAVPLAQAMKTIQEWLPSNTTALAHNAFFDSSFFYAAAMRTGMKETRFRQQWICSKRRFEDLNKRLGLGAPNCKLATLAAMSGHWGPSYDRGAHQAIDDALACLAGYRWLVDKASAAGGQLAVRQVR
jgi:DNA polymerase III epsilon subunit-like protein